MPLILTTPYLRKLISDIGGGYVPAEYDPYFNNVTMLLNMEGSEGATATDLRGTVFNGTPRISSEQKKFGASSLKVMRGTTSGLYVSGTPAMGMSSGQYCIEGWFYFKDLNLTQYLIDPRLEYRGHDSGALYIEGGYFKYEIGTSSNTYSNSAPAPASILNSWNHIALYKAADGKIYFALNGKPMSSFGVGSASIGTSGNLALGGDIFGNAHNAFNGYIDEVRVTKGRARYPTTAFTPPTTAFDRTGKKYQDWTIAWYAKEDNYASNNNGTTGNTFFDYDIPLAQVQNATRAAIAFFDSTQNGEITVTAMHSFDIPAEWKVKHPLNYPQIDNTLYVRNEMSQSDIGQCVLRYGWNSFSDRITDPWGQTNSTWGRIGITNSQAPYYNGFAINVAQNDNCCLSNQGYNATVSSPNRRFIILVK